MLALYIVTSLVIWLIFRIVAGFIDRLKLKEFDRQLGAVFGLTKGVLLCVAITLFAVSLLPDQQRHSIMVSRSGYYIAMLLNRADMVMPEELHDVLHPYIHRAQQQLDAASRLGPPDDWPDHQTADRQGPQWH
jgi:membrane protein required for colicin V production